MAAIRPATAPGTNQMETSPAVTASTTPKTTMAAIHNAVISLSPPPFKYSIHRATRAVTAASPPHSGPFVGRGQVAHKISQRRFQCPGLHPLRRRRRLLAAQGDLLAEQVVHGDAVAVADIDDLLKLRVSSAGLPLAHRLPGDLQLGRKVLLGHAPGPAELLQPLSKCHTPLLSVCHFSRTAPPFPPTLLYIRQNPVQLQVSVREVRLRRRLSLLYHAHFANTISFWLQNLPARRLQLRQEPAGISTFSAVCIIIGKTPR